MQVEVETISLIKWVSACVAMCVSTVCLGLGIGRYAEAVEAKAAMQCGYVQAETWTGKLVWQPLKPHELTETEGENE